MEPFNQKDIDYYVSLGFDRQLVIQGLNACPNHKNQDLVISQLIDLKSKNEQMLNQAQKAQNHKIGNNEDFEVNQAILNSIQTAKNQNVQFTDFLNPIDRKRKNGVPVGLKNIGNTCYFNSLLQTYFMNYRFVKEIIEFQDPQEDIPDAEPHKQRIQSSIQLVKNLRLLFAQMILSDRKYVDPSIVLNNIVDDFGQIIQIGDQKDIGEFNLYFLARIEEGLQQQQKYKQIHRSRMQEEPIQEEDNEKISIAQEVRENDNDRTIKISFMRETSRQVVEEDSLVSQLFFGKIKTYLNFYENKQLQVHNEQELFTIILLDVINKELYEAWDNFHINLIQDFKTPNGEIVQAEKSSWIISAPGFLFFQIQRVIYDKEKGMIKLNDKFNFEKHIYIDRFLEKNQSNYLSVREKVQKLKQQAQIYEQALRKIQNYNSSNMNLGSIIEQTQYFIQEQTQQNAISDILKNPTFFSKVLDNKSLNSLIISLQILQKDLNIRINELQFKYNDVKNQISEAYQKFLNTKYNLVSILMHSGVADYGHYYSFICDYQQNVWRRYNDIQIKEETEENVFKEALGGNGNQSAYCLIYSQDSSLFPVNQALPMRSYFTTENRTNQQVQDMYQLYLDLNQKEKNQIQMDNLKLQEEIHDYESEIIVRNLVDDYLKKFEFVNETSRKFRTDEQQVLGKFKPIHLLNFGIFLKNSVENANGNLDEGIKLFIFQTALQDHQPPIKDFDEIKHNQPVLFEKLKSHFNQMGNFKSPDLEKMSQLYRLNAFKEEYVLLVKLNWFCQYFLEMCLEEQWEKSIYICHFTIELYQSHKNSLIQLCNDIIKIILLRICKTCEKFAQEYNFEKMMYYMEMITAFAIKHIPKQHIVLVQIQVWFNDCHKLISKSLSEQNATAIRDFFQKFQNFEYYQALENFYQIADEKIDRDIMNKNINFSIDIKQREDLDYKHIHQLFANFKIKYSAYCELLNEIVKNKIPKMLQDRNQLKV